MFQAVGAKRVVASVARTSRSFNVSARMLSAPNPTPGTPVTAQAVKTTLKKLPVDPVAAGASQSIPKSPAGTTSKPKDLTLNSSSGSPSSPVVEKVIQNNKEEAKPKKSFSLTGFLFKAIFASAVLYGGTMFAATKSETVMDFVIDKQLPYYEELIHLIENGSVQDIKNNWTAVTSSVGTTKDKIEQLTTELEKKGEHFIEKTKKKVEETKSAISHSLPAEQLQKKVEIEPVHEAFERLPLVAINEATSGFVDESVKETIDSFNDLIKIIDGTNLGDQKHTIIQKINNSISVLATKVDTLNNSFTKELESKLKSFETKLLADFTQKELDLTLNMLSQYKLEKAQLEILYKEKLQKEIELTKQAITQAAVNATTMVRIEQTKRFEAMIKERIDEERNGRLKNLDALNSRVEELEALALTLESQAKATTSRSLVQQSLANLKSLLFHVRADTPPQSFNKYIDALEEATSGTDDELLKEATVQLKQLLTNESNQSILTTPQLLSAWEQLSPELRSASLLPPNAGLLGHLASFLFSKLLIPVKGVKPDGKDIESVIGRVELSLARGELDVAVEEVANLKGWTRRLADDWVKEGRKRLEAEFLVGVVEAEAKLV